MYFVKEWFARNILQAPLAILSLDTRSRDGLRRDRRFPLPFFLYRFNESGSVAWVHLARFEICRCDVTRMRYVTGLLGTLRGTVGIRGRVFRPPKRFRRTCRSRLSERVERGYCLGLIMFTSESRERGYNHVYHASRSSAIFRKRARWLSPGKAGGKNTS